jgi:acetyltransferase-like isoleucine patch superfamily enzyme
MNPNVTDAERLERHASLVQFLNDQMALGAPQIHDPVVMIRREAIVIGDGSRIDSFVKLEGGERLIIGRYVHIASFAHIGIGGGEVLIEDFAAVASGAKIISGSNQVDAQTMSACAPGYMQHVQRKKTIISRYATVLTNAVVLPGVTLHEGAVLAAGGVATRDIPAWEIWGGVPAKFMAKREVTP